MRSDLPASRRAIERNGKLAPENGSIASFVTWLQQLELHGQWTQHDLYLEYESIAAVTGRARIPLKRFKRTLVEAGCHCWRADIEVEGKRTRPEMVTIPRPR